MSAKLSELDQVRIAVIGLGYVGLPLAVELASKFPVVGFDIDARRLAELKAGKDRTNETSAAELGALEGKILFSNSSLDLANCNFFIVTVPTPIDSDNQPDLTALRKSSETVGRAIKKGGVVVYESTVYPGATEEVCIPIIEQVSGLKFNEEFFAGYSPERINPGDKQHPLTATVKITSGSTPQVADFVDSVYSSIIKAGTCKASSIRVAEAAKIIENIQRDVNIGLVNELCQLFKKIGIEPREVLAAAGTKWNFHVYQPGLVGGHCIGVDPYYMTHMANKIGFHTEMILAGRRINDGMAEYVAHDIVTTMMRKQVAAGKAKLLVLGFSFKQNVPDLRNTKVADLVKVLSSYVADIVIYDPHVDPEEALHEYGLTVTNSLPAGPFDGAVVAVSHDEIVALGEKGLRALLATDRPSFIYDVKAVLPVGASDGRL